MSPWLRHAKPLGRPTQMLRDPMVPMELYQWTCSLNNSPSARVMLLSRVPGGWWRHGGHMHDDMDLCVSVLMPVDISLPFFSYSITTFPEMRAVAQICSYLIPAVKGRFWRPAIRSQVVRGPQAVCSLSRDCTVLVYLGADMYSSNSCVTCPGGVC
jgi:hypothetical protein